MSNTQVKHHYQDEQIARDYDRQRFSSFPGRTFDRLEKRALKKVLNHVRKKITNPRTLDIPCGTGRITRLWLHEGLQVLGGDISEAMLAVARETCAIFGNKVDFQCLDLDELQLKDNSFELVTCIRLFHHLSSAERAATIKELARVSSRYVMINVSFSSTYYRFRRRIKQLLGQGISRASSSWSEIESEAKAAGLTVGSVSMVFPLLSEDMILLLEKVQ